MRQHGELIGKISISLEQATAIAFSIPNPLLGIGFEERDSRALVKYEELQMHINEVKSALQLAM